MKNFTNIKQLRLLLEAEVSPSAKDKFESRYLQETGIVVTPGNPLYYQNQSNKWGAELRVYFNDSIFADYLKQRGCHVEFPREGYKSGEYRYRFNNSDRWWELVKDYGFRLGTN